MQKAHVMCMAVPHHCLVDVSKHQPQSGVLLGRLIWLGALWDVRLCDIRVQLDLSYAPFL
jgi:hypothetical protein